MGSLVNFESIIMEKTDIKVKTLDMVTTSLVLEAIRKATILDMSLESIYSSLKDFRGYSSFEEETCTHDESKNNPSNNNAIITICASGQGTAIKLKELIENIVLNTTEDEIAIFPISVNDINNSIMKIKEKYNIIASVGIVNPEIDSPYIPLEELIGGQGENTLMSIIKDNNFTVEVKHENVVANDLCQDSLNQFLTFLNPSKIIDILYEFVSKVEEKTMVKFNNATRIRVMVHLGCALERMVINDGIEYKGDQGKLDNRKVDIIREASKIFKKALNISLTEEEIFYLSEMI
jgi:transcriptional regulatory protein LevR